MSKPSWLPPLAVVSMSGGKDSTATGLIALDQYGEGSVRCVFADTGNEHPATLEYIYDYLPSIFGPIHTVKADFAKKMEGKRKFIQEKWPEHGIAQKKIDRALAILQPTGNPFLDLCMWKGRFPSRMAQFCTQELKRYPLETYFFDLMANFRNVEIESWRGVRRDESAKRKDTALRERAAEGFWIVHPIAEWTAQQTVDFVISKGVKLNVLYERGMGRVGCMPCINVRKDELAEIARRFPDEIDRIREWEALVSDAAKRDMATFFAVQTDEREYGVDFIAAHGIDGKVRWAQTKYGGKEIDPEKVGDAPMCSSSYGLCE
jgi:3'-phosphoadenosine 5'-phosphosulfate sulfotransferase (PAPS reductase)/FAD synthetase